MEPVFSGVQHFGYTAVALLLQITLIAAAGLTSGQIVRSQGPTWESTAYRSTLAVLAFSVITMLLLSERVHSKVTVIRSGSPIIVALHADPSRADALAAAASINTIATSSVNDRAGFTNALPGIWTPVDVALVIWLVGVFVGLARILAGAVTLARLRRTATPITQGLPTDVMAQLASRLTIPIPNLYVDDSITSPFLAGVRRPAIFLPTGYDSLRDPHALRAVLAHELTHLKRRDCLWLVVCQIYAAILWFHPLVHVLYRKLRDASEDACDATVLNLDCPATEYATTLLDLAQQAGLVRKSRVLGIGVVSIRSSLGRRIKIILQNAGKPASRFSPAARIAFAAIATAITGVSIAVFCPAAPIMSLDDVPYAWTPPPGYLENSTFARLHGWKAEPIKSVSGIHLPEDPAIPSNMPTALDEHQMDLLSENGMMAVEPRDAPPSDALRKTIEGMLAKSPHCFYAENAMSVWYAERGNMSAFRKWRERAFSDAPGMLIGRVQYPDGRPVAGYITGWTLTYVDHDVYRGEPAGFTATDKDGFLYIPAYHHMIDGYTNEYTGKIAEDLNAKMAVLQQSVSSFTWKGRIGLLPPVIVRPYIAVSGSFDNAAGTQNHPLIVDNDSLDLTWSAYPHATSYYTCLNELIIYKAGADKSTTTKNVLNLKNDARKIHIDMGGLNSHTVYLLTVLAYRANDTAEPYAVSRDYYFIPKRGKAPADTIKAQFTFPDGKSITTP